MYLPDRSLVSRYLDICRALAFQIRETRGYVWCGTVRRQTAVTVVLSVLRIRLTYEYVFLMLLEKLQASSKEKKKGSSGGKWKASNIYIILMHAVLHFKEATPVKGVLYIALGRATRYTHFINFYHKPVAQSKFHAT